VEVAGGLISQCRFRPEADPWLDASQPIRTTLFVNRATFLLAITILVTQACTVDTRHVAADGMPRNAHALIEGAAQKIQRVAYYAADVGVVGLDPRTLEVIDRNTSHGHRKLADTTANAHGVLAEKEFLARQIVEVVQDSAREALRIRCSAGQWK
jgi:hypothetical protein